MPKHLFFIYVTMALVAANAQQQNTIPEEVRAQQGPVRRIVSPQTPQMGLQAQVNEAAIIVRARVASGSTRLTTDEQWVVTTFALSPIEVLLDTRPPSPAPAPPPTYEATFMGGEIKIDGFPATSVDLTLPAPVINDELVLVLERSDELNSWVPIVGPYSVYKVTAQGAVESSKPSAPYHGRALNDLLADIRKFVAAR